VEGILRLLSHRRDRRAWFQSVVALSGPGFRTKIFIGKVRGRIATRAKGSNGFGFDPIFIPRGARLTFGEAGQDVKNKCSHRSQAFREMAAWYLKRWPDGRYDQRSPKIIADGVEGSYV
jgi:XTP/dITP diphosphohydrolase